jgi:hypothetical protein
MLSQMSRTGILVNIGRAQIVVKEDLIRFLRENPAFIYATDVWWNQQEMQRDIELLTIPEDISPREGYFERNWSMRTLYVWNSPRSVWREHHYPEKGAKCACLITLSKKIEIALPLLHKDQRKDPGLPKLPRQTFRDILDISLAEKVSRASKRLYKEISSLEELAKRHTPSRSHASEDLELMREPILIHPSPTPDLLQLKASRGSLKNIEHVALGG